MPTGRTRRVIHDLVYDWPGTGGGGAALGGGAVEVAIFSLSKLAGYAATRVGWAFVKDPAVAAAMRHYIFINGQGAGVEARYRATRVLQAVSAPLAGEGSFAAFVRGALQQRWADTMRVPVLEPGFGH